MIRNLRFWRPPYSPFVLQAYDAWAGWVSSPLPPKGADLQSAAFADSLPTQIILNYYNSLLPYIITLLSHWILQPGRDLNPQPLP